eukprot:4119232-Amphidinium_carterae.1
MVLIGVKRRFNMLPLPECKRAKQRTVLASLVPDTSPCIRARVVFLSMEHTSKASKKQMVCVEFLDESAKVVRLTTLGARHIAAIKELAFGAMVEIE